MTEIVQNLYLLLPVLAWPIWVGFSIWGVRFAHRRQSDLAAFYAFMAIVLSLGTMVYGFLRGYSLLCAILRYLET